VQSAKCTSLPGGWRCKVQSAPAHLEAGGDKRYMIPHRIPVLQCIVPTSLFPGLHKGFSDVRDFPSSPPLFILHKDSPTPRPKKPCRCKISTFEDREMVQPWMVELIPDLETREMDGASLSISILEMDWPSLLTRTMMLLRVSALHRPRSMVSLVCHKFCLCRLPHSTP
jgi:hypothetical protein